MALRDLSLKAKLSGAFAALSLLVVLVSCLSLLALRNEHRSFSGYVEETALRAKHANDVLDAANARAVSARNLVLVTTPADIAQEKAAVTRAHEKVGTVLATLQADLAKMGNVTPRERETFAALLAVEARYGPLALNIAGMALEGRKDAAVAKMNAECRPLLAELTAAAGAYLEAIETQSHAEVAAAGAANGLNVAITLGGCVLGLAAAALLAWLLTRAVVAPIDEAVRVARTVAAGDLRSRIEVRSSDETGKLLGALKTMNAGLVEIVRSVRESSDSIATGSAQIATGNADLSARTEQQASSLQQTAASMEQMNATVRSNAATTQQAAGLAQGASEAATQGGVVVGQVVATMDQIADGSRKIAEIIGTIDGIAFQTNILALNAAVEAARAGEQGRGFAVVAGEVRSLAGRCAEAAREIKALIGASVERVDAGTRLVGEARSAMDGIVQQVKRVAGLIHEIGTATAEQTDGIGQVNVAVSSLDQTTQQNAALVEQSAAAAESLREQSARLARCVGVFQL